MELLEGETLRARLAEGAYSAAQGHSSTACKSPRGWPRRTRKAIVHRDLKPENLFLTSDGRVKILDFGLAKASAAAPDETQSPTLPATEPGVVMGTVGYMSPEQVRGKPADRRSDIFSLGAIVYEMLLGERAFRGDSAAETMAAIAQKDPPELALPTGRFPPSIERVLRHCLEKRPEDRFDTARDLAFALEPSTEQPECAGGGRGRGSGEGATGVAGGARQRRDRGRPCGPGCSSGVGVAPRLRRVYARSPITAASSRTPGSRRTARPSSSERRGGTSRSGRT